MDQRVGRAAFAGIYFISGAYHTLLAGGQVFYLACHLGSNFSLCYLSFISIFSSKVHLSPTLSALIMTAVISLIIGVPLVIGVFFLQQEIIEFYSMAVRRLQAGYIDLPENIKNLPVVGEYIKNTLWQINKNPEDSMAAIRQWIQSHLYYGKLAFDVALKNLAKLGMALMTVFFFYRDGLSLIKQIRQAMRNIIGDRIDHHIDSIASTTQAVVYGIGLTALAQALLAGVGYAFAGAPNPILLTLITFVVALIPFGTPFAWGGVAVWRCGYYRKGIQQRVLGLGCGECSSSAGWII